MSYIKKSLIQDEQIVKLFKQHWIAWVPFVVSLPLIFTVVGIVVPIFFWILLRSTENGVTNRRVIRKTGLISRNTEEMRLSRIETVEIKQGMLDRLLGMGTVVVTGTGISSGVIKNIDEPMKVKRAIDEACD